MTILQTTWKTCTLKDFIFIALKGKLRYSVHQPVNKLTLLLQELATAIKNTLREPALKTRFSFKAAHVTVECCCSADGAFHHICKHMWLMLMHGKKWWSLPDLDSIYTVGSKEKYIKFFLFHSGKWNTAYKTDEESL